MCTLTFIPLSKTDFILTSSRDEQPGRKTLPPALYRSDSVEIVYPKDAQAGGTWLGISSHKRLVNLLNGAFEPHNHKSTYRLSRGIVVKHFLEVNDIHKGIAEFDFKGIEPFTIVLITWHNSLKIFTLIWDEKVLHYNELKPDYYIFSSSQLYSKDMKQKRESWFTNFKLQNDFIAQKVWNFHYKAGDGNKSSDLIMDRVFVKTVSISQIIKKNQRIQFKYKELQSTNETQIQVSW